MPAPLGRRRTLGGGSTNGADVAERWAIWRAEKARRVADDRGPRGELGRRLRRPDAARRRRRRASRSTSATTPTRSAATSSAPRQSVLMSGYLGSIGFGFPAAMGAWAAAPERQIVAVTGDGGFGQYLAELTTAVKYDMDITHVLLDNSMLGKITKEQRAGRVRRVADRRCTTPTSPSTRALCGALGIRVERADQLDAALRQALAHEGPALVHVIADPELI